jgi:hypothetical protein
MSKSDFYFYIGETGEQLFFNINLIAYTSYRTRDNIYEVFLRNTSINSGLAQRIKLSPSEYNDLISHINNFKHDC